MTNDGKLIAIQLLAASGPTTWLPVATRSGLRRLSNCEETGSYERVGPRDDVQFRLRRGEVRVERPQGQRQRVRIEVERGVEEQLQPDRVLDPRVGHRVAARRRGAIVRPLGDVVVLMPALAITEADLRRLVTITGVKMSPDLREARVYWTVHGDPEQRKHTAKGLENARGFLRREIGIELKLRVTPDLHFTYDEAIDRGERIEQLIREVHDEERTRHPEPPVRERDE